MIRNVIFDMGGVLIDWNPAAIVARLGRNSALLLREVFGGMEWVSMDHGIMTQQEGYERICRRLPEQLHEDARCCVFDWWKESLSPIPGMAELIREIRVLGYGIYLLSNATSTLHQFFDRIPGSECFDCSSRSMKFSNCCLRPSRCGRRSASSLTTTRQTSTAPLPSACREQFSSVTLHVCAESCARQAYR